MDICVPYSKDICLMFYFSSTEHKWSELAKTTEHSRFQKRNSVLLKHGVCVQDINYNKLNEPLRPGSSINYEKVTKCIVMKGSNISSTAKICVIFFGRFCSMLPIEHFFSFQITAQNLLLH